MQPYRSPDPVHLLDVDCKPIQFLNGYKAIELETWEHFPQFITKNDNLGGFIFRGQPRVCYKLKPTLLRRFEQQLEQQPPGSQGTYSDAVDWQLRRFRVALRGRILLTDREAGSDSEIWAIGQHHGLATPLLDWTASPMVAAFFAFSEDRSPLSRRHTHKGNTSKDDSVEPREVDSEDRAVYVLNARRLNKVFRDQVDREDTILASRLRNLKVFSNYDDRAWSSGLTESIAERLLSIDLDTYSDCKTAVKAAEQKVPRVISPFSGENQRIVNQRGLFTGFYKDIPLENWVTSYFNGSQPEYTRDEPILLKIVLPEGERHNALRWLDAANVNYLSLFPDLFGAAQFSNSRVALDAKK